VTEPPLLLAVLQVDGIGLNTTTFGIVASIVIAMAGAITFLFRWATGRQDRENEALREDNRLLMEALIDVLRTANRSTDVADDAARELLKRRAARKTR
jgi:hypothetical protein